ncbi:MAG: transglycosylase domain-containing protein [Anaerolineae bacterium]|nr:transglycosylase domain-containing protein [Anaerolineae bacterium]
MDHPEDRPVVPPEDAARPDPTPPGTAPASGQEKGAQPGDLWHEPPVEEGSSRPVVVETWFTPQPPLKPEPERATPPATSETAAPQEEVSPRERGDWFTPLEAKVDALLDGADKTIPEIHASDEAQPEEAGAEAVPGPADAGAAGDATAAASSAPLPEDTPLPTDTPSESPVEEQKAPAPDPSRFEQVEQQVRALRERYQAGEITREALQDELRGLMILGEDGQWWMLGLESDRWYHYDGQAWVPANPPGYEQRVRGSAVRTETGMQQVVVESAAGLADDQVTLESVEGGPGDESAPLPLRVPQDDPGATLVSPHTPFLEPVRRSDAPTLQKGQEVDAAAANLITMPHGLSGPQPDQQTIRSVAVAARETMTHGELRAVPAEPPHPPKPPIGAFPQPDYSAALGAAHNRNTYVKWGIRFSIFGIIGGMALTLLVLLLMIGYYLYKVDQYAEAVASLHESASGFETTLILNAQGATLAEFNNPDTGQRKVVPLNQISPWLIHATVSTENETFYQDPGFSVLAIVRAAYNNLRAGDVLSGPGASTITQQLARALVLETEFASQRTAERKIVEIIVASEIKRKYTKNEILEIYLNEIFYGNFAYGIEAAAQTYFDKPASELNPIEAAFLAGLPQSPATYDPVVNREAAIQRMRTVLRLMAEANGTGCIAIQHDDTTQWGVPSGGSLCIIARPQPNGTTLYYYTTPNTPEPQEMSLELALVETKTFTPPANQFIHPHFVNYVWQQLEDTYGPQAIYSAGYRVYTTLDEAIQTASERAIASQLGALQARGINARNASAVVMNPRNGAVLAMVGSADYNNKDIDGQVNIAFTAQQPGSAIKPFVYLTAFMPDEQGRYLTPASVLWDVRTDFNGYVPTNYDNQYHGPKTAREALGNSLNVPAVKVLQQAGLLRFTELATRFGIRFPLGNPVERNAGLPTALGAVEVRLFDMVAAFAALGNNGVGVEPFSIVYIEDSKGNEIYRAGGQAGQQIVPPEYAYLITNILSDGAARAEEFGRGWPLELQGGRTVAVKTGTSNDSRDVWTIGYTPQYAVGVWVGNSDNSPMTGLSGYFGAAPIWNEIMEAAHAGLAVESFQPPPGVVQAEVCRDSGTVPSPQCAGRTYVELFVSNAPPPGPDQDIYRSLYVDTFTQKLANDSCAGEAEYRTFLAISDSSAYNWLNNDPAGNAWLAQRGLQVPIMPPPTEYCNPAEPRPYVVLSAPAQDAPVEGVIQVMGTITMPNFSRYEIRYGIGHSPTAFSEPLIVDPQERREPNALLGQLDTRVLQNGPYTLRLIAIDQYGRFVRRDVRINVNNQAAPPPMPTPAPTLTLPFAEGSFPDAALIPTLTPTWTLTPTPG